MTKKTSQFGQKNVGKRKMTESKFVTEMSQRKKN